jgi:hypothetical protein
MSPLIKQNDSTFSFAHRAFRIKLGDPMSWHKPSEQAINFKSRAQLSSEVSFHPLKTDFKTENIFLLDKGSHLRSELHSASGTTKLSLYL